MRRLGALFVVRLLLVSNAIVVTAVGGTSFAFVARPAGVIEAVICWLLAVVLISLVPRTDPYRQGGRRRGRATRHR